MEVPPPPMPFDADAPPDRSVTFGQALVPVLTLLALVVYGLILRPQVFDRPAFPLEIVFVLAAVVAVGWLRWLGHGWAAVQATIIQKLTQALPAFFIFLMAYKLALCVDIVSSATLTR